MLEITLPDAVGNLELWSSDELRIVRVAVTANLKLTRDSPVVSVKRDDGEVIEVPSPRSGRVTQVLVGVGDRVKVGQRLFTIEEDESSTKRAMLPELASLALRVAVTCPSCSATVSVGELVDVCHCQVCGATFLIAPAWEQILDLRGDVYELLTGREDRAEHTGTFPAQNAPGGTTQFWCDAKSALPRCACGQAVPLPERAPSGLEEALPCGSCGARLSALCATAEYRSKLEELRFFVAASATEMAVPVRPVLFKTKCSNCGARLEFDGTSRIGRCQFCGASERLPDRFADAVDPLAACLPLYLILRPDRRRLMARRYDSTDRAVRDAQAPETAIDALNYLANHGDADTKLALVRNPNLPDSLLVSLSYTRSEKLRAAVVERFKQRGGSPVLAKRVEEILHSQQPTAASKEQRQEKRDNIVALVCLALFLLLPLAMALVDYWLH